MAIEGLSTEKAAGVLVYPYERHLVSVLRGFHDRQLMDRKYMYSDGAIHDARWFSQLVLLAKSKAIGDYSDTVLNMKNDFLAGVRIKLPIFTSTVEYVYEMKSADMFIGSMSEISQYTAQTVSCVGIQLPSIFRTAAGLLLSER